VANVDEPGIPVADAIELLRGELEEALGKGSGHEVQFGVSDVTLTVSVVTSRKRDANGKLRWWVVEAGSSGSSSQEVSQQMVLTLRPQRAASDGARTDLTVGAPDTED